MDMNVIRRALHDVPFKPFTLKLADGRSESVPHPEFVALGSRVVAIVRDDNSVTTIEPLLIVSLEQEPLSGPGENGASNGREN
jgi:virulence-associated protein VagC